MQTPTAREVIDLLGLAPHHTCGFVAASFASRDTIPADAVPARFGGGARRDRALGGTLYFLVSEEAHVVCHAIRSDQVYHHYLGAALEVLLLHPDGRGEVRVCGGDLAAGERPQLVIPADTVHVSRVKGGTGYALLGTSEWIEVDPADVWTPAPGELAARWPSMAAEIAAFTGTGEPIARPMGAARD